MSYLLCIGIVNKYTCTYIHTQVMFSHHCNRTCLLRSNYLPNGRMKQKENEELVKVQSCMYSKGTIPMFFFNVSSLVRFSAGSTRGFAWSLYECVALWRAVYSSPETERPNELFAKSREFLPSSVLQLFAI